MCLAFVLYNYVVFTDNSQVSDSNTKRALDDENNTDELETKITKRTVDDTNIEKVETKNAKRATDDNSDDAETKKTKTE